MKSISGSIIGRGILIILAIVIILMGILIIDNCRRFQYLGTRQKWIEEKFKEVKTGMTEREIVRILGEPESKEWIAVDDYLAKEIARKHEKLLKYSYNILLVKLPFTVEGGAWAAAHAYFEEKDRKLVLFKSSSVGLIPYYR